MTKKSKRNIFIWFFLISLLLPTRFVLAQTATSEAEENDPVEIIRKNIEEKVEEKLDSTEQQKRGFFGQIVDLFNQSIVLETTQGKKTAKIDEETSLIDEKRKEINFEDLEIGSYLIAMGYSETPEKLLAKRIVVTPQPKENKRVAVIGRVEEIKKNEIDLRLLKDDSSWKISLTQKTQIIRKTKQETEEIEAEEIETENLIVIVGIPEETNKIEGKIAYLVSPVEKASSSSESEEE